MQIAIFFNNYRGLKVYNHLVNKKKYKIDIYLSKKNLNENIIKEIKQKFYIVNKINSKLILKIKKKNYDLLIVAGWPLIFPKNLINASKKGTINLHAGKLPEYRGGSPLNWQVIEGKKNIFISIIKMTKNIDTGPIYKTKKIPLKKNEDIGDLRKKVNKSYPYMVEDVIEKITKKIKPKKQSLNNKRYLKQRNEKDGKILWNEMTAYQVFNLVRALAKPYPGAFYVEDEKKIKIHKCKISKTKQFIKPGKIFFKSTNKFIGCKRDSIKILDEKRDMSY